MIKSAILNRYIRLYKQAFTDYRWFLYYLQRQILEPNHRAKISSVIGSVLPKNSSGIAKLQEQDFLECKEDGLCFLEDLVSKDEALQIRQHLMGRPCFDPNRLNEKGFFTPDDAHKACLHAYYRVGDILECPLIIKLANHPRIIAVLEELFQCKPTISFIQAWWIRSGFDWDANRDNLTYKYPYSYHRDMDDWSEMRIFVYLTDVDEFSGPHSFIKKTYDLPAPHQFNKYSTSPDELEASGFPVSQNLIDIHGKPGTAWLMNTYGFHRGKVPTHKHRLLVCITYTLLPIPFAPAKPILYCSPHANLDPYINRVYVKIDKSLGKDEFRVDWSMLESFELAYPSEPRKHLRLRQHI